MKSSKKLFLRFVAICSAGLLCAQAHAANITAYADADAATDAAGAIPDAVNVIYLTGAVLAVTVLTVSLYLRFTKKGVGGR